MSDYNISFIPQRGCFFTDATIARMKKELGQLVVLNGERGDIGFRLTRKFMVAIPERHQINQLVAAWKYQNENGLGFVKPNERPKPNELSTKNY